jgi:imidazole glycerol-phosphate synthase subunit HisH
MIAVIDYQAGNIASVCNALKRLGVPWVMASQPDEILRASGVIMPGQGRAGAALRVLRDRGIAAVIPELKVPFLGICLGMQLMAEHTTEDESDGLGIIPGQVVMFPSWLRIPHMGWNQVEFVSDSLLGAGIVPGSYFYFAHSYYLAAGQGCAAGRTHYGVSFASVVRCDNFHAVQFHPEKSGPTGMQLLKNFCDLCK